LEVCGLPRGKSHTILFVPLAGEGARGGGPYTISIPLRLCVKTMLTPKLKYTRLWLRFDSPSSL